MKGRLCCRSKFKHGGKGNEERMQVVPLIGNRESICLVKQGKMDVHDACSNRSYYGVRAPMKEESYPWGGQKKSCM